MEGHNLWRDITCEGTELAEEQNVWRDRTCGEIEQVER